MSEPDTPLVTTFSPFARTLAVHDVAPTGTHVVIVADEAQRHALAEAADLLAVESFRAELLVRPWSGHGFAVSGRVAATLSQSCVVTLEPVETTVDEVVDVKLVPPEEMAKYVTAPDEEGGIDLDASALDAPDPIENGVIDLGAIATEFFMLGIDPYPKRPGAVFDPAAQPGGADDAPMSPFAALARLKQE